MKIVSRCFRVTGKVQGVYFRHSTRLEAERLNLRGAAKNLPDGAVEVLVLGAADDIEALRVWLHRGPSLAQVAAVEEIALDPERLGSVESRPFAVE